MLMRKQQAWADTDKRIGAVLTAFYALVGNLIFGLVAHRWSLAWGITIPFAALALAVFTSFMWQLYHPKPDATTKFCWKLGKKAKSTMATLLRKHSMQYGGETSQRVVEIINRSPNSGNKAFAESLGDLLETCGWYVDYQGCTDDPQYQNGIWLEDGGMGTDSTHQVLTEALLLAKIKVHHSVAPSSQYLVQVIVGARDC
jgi:hypothetical protein